jgi:hypothetical protein
VTLNQEGRKGENDSTKFGENYCERFVDSVGKIRGFLVSRLIDEIRG